MSSNKNILYLYELPKESTTSVVISEIIKELTGYELPEAP
jgi:RNA recognition motif-containing protein